MVIDAEKLAWAWLSFQSGQPFCEPKTQAIAVKLNILDRIDSYIPLTTKACELGHTPDLIPAPVSQERVTRRIPCPGFRKTRVCW